MMSQDSISSHNQRANEEHDNTRLRIGDFYPVSSTLYNGEPATEIFFQGCPWHCSNCRQPALITAHDSTSYDWQDILYYLMSRRGLIDHVVFNGAEPLSQTHLLDAILQCKTMGFILGLHTCGIYPLRLQSVLPLIDWVWFEVFGLPEDYQINTAVPCSGSTAWTGLQFAVASGVPVVCEVFSPANSASREKLGLVADQLAAMGVQHLIITVGHDEPTLLGECSEQLQSIAQRFPQFRIRNAAQA